MVLKPKDQASAFIAASGGDGQALFVPGWGTAEWTTLLSYSTEVDLPSGATLIRQGEAGRTLYFVVAGAIEVAIVYGDQALGSLRKVGPGSVVGEMAFFDGGLRSAKVWAISDSKLLRLNFEDYEKFAAANVQRSSELLFALGGLVARRLRETTARRRS